ncbi:MAG: hypothetical protein JNM96_00790 [Bacteroidia bacterium]|nr:hypothetical protein [Bacteroidia bacterium]
MIRFCVIFLFIISKLTSQLDNSALYLGHGDTIPEKTAYFKIINFNYFKNNEYFGPIADGYTLFGTQLNPQVGVQISKNVSLEAGIFLQKDFGNKEFELVLPTFSFRYEKDKFKMIFGNIDGSLNHQLIEPVYNFERVITNRLENGAQFLYNHKYFDFDTWVDWQSMIYKYSNKKEQLWGGLIGNVLKLGSDSMQIRIPVQFTAKHVGGQIDTAKGPSYTNVTFNSGIAFSKKFHSKILSEVYFDARYLAKRTNSFDTTLVPNVGTGVMLNAGLNIFKTDVMLSYWSGNHFNTDFGGYLYASESSTVRFAGTYQNQRNLLILRITKTFPLAKNVSISLRAEPNYDLGFGRFDYSYGLYININERIALKRKK